MKPTFDRRRSPTDYCGATINIRRPTTGCRVSDVGCRPAVGCRMSNVVILALGSRKVSHEEAMAKVETEFGEYVNQGYIHRDYGRGVIDGNDMDRIKIGIEMSINLSAEDIDRILS